MSAYVKLEFGIREASETARVARRVMQFQVRNSLTHAQRNGLDLFIADLMSDIERRLAITLDRLETMKSDPDEQRTDISAPGETDDLPF